MQQSQNNSNLIKPTDPTDANPKHQTLLKQCPYLSTIRKNLLDFDFQKICSITLSHTNIYICLVCGRYFQGRSPKSPAYQHSIQSNHFIYMNLQTARIYCLPDDYQVDGYTIQDVKFNLQPKYTKQQLQKLQKNIGEIQYNVDGKEFRPGVMGMNDIGKCDWVIVVVYILNAVREIRQFFVLREGFQGELVNQFGNLLKKIWNPMSFKGLVSPHQFLQAVTDCSAKKFKIGSQADPSIFLLWLIDNLNKGIKKQKNTKFDIQQLFRGKLKTSIIKGIKDSYQYQQIASKITQIPFSILKLQFPQKGIFNKTQLQIPIQQLLQKYTGRVPQKHAEGLRYAKIIQFPQYLILVFKRFHNNGYTIQKDSSHLLYSINLTINSNGINAQYQLIGQVCHHGGYDGGGYKVVVDMSNRNNSSNSNNSNNNSNGNNNGSNQEQQQQQGDQREKQSQSKWFEIQDLQVRPKSQKQILLMQPYIQMYRLAKTKKSDNKKKDQTV